MEYFYCAPLDSHQLSPHFLHFCLLIKQVLTAHREMLGILGWDIYDSSIVNFQYYKL